jgi:prevent-host-death family protein
MSAVNIRDAKTHLSRLIARAEAGETVIIARAGKPVVKLVPINASAPKKKRRLGFMAGQFMVPNDFDRMDAGEIETLFTGP